MEKATLVDSTHHSIRISWTKPTLCTKQHPVPTQDVTNYTVYWKKNVPGQVFQALSGIAVTGNTEEYTLPDRLDPDSLYQIEVRGVNRNGEGKPAPVLSVTTSEHSTNWFVIILSNIIRYTWIHFPIHTDVEKQLNAGSEKTATFVFCSMFTELKLSKIFFVQNKRFLLYHYSWWFNIPGMPDFSL